MNAGDISGLSQAERIRGAESGTRVATNDQTAWRRLTAAETTEELAASWVALMFDMLDEAEACAVFLTDPEGGRMRPMANWPEARLPGGGLLAAAEDAIASGRGNVRGALQDHAPEGELVALAAPLTLNGRTLGAVGAEITPRTQADLRAAMRSLQWGAAWLRDALRRDAASVQEDRHEHAMQALNAVVGVAEQADFPTAARAAATDLATRFRCDRVSIGFRRLGRTRVAAISHSAQFSKRMSLVRMLGAAMDEAVDQRGVVLFPSELADAPVSTHRHELLARGHAISQIVTVPLYAVDRFVGAIVFERGKDRPVTQADVEILEAVATVIAPVLDEKRRNDRWLIVKVFEALGRQFARLVGPGRLLRKLIVVGALVLGAFLYFATGPNRVSADAVVEGRIQRTISAPFDGFIAEGLVRAGDTVTTGQPMVLLDDRELALERLRLITELQRQTIEYDRALAVGDRAQTSIWRSQIDQTEARIDLIDRQLARTRLNAPFDGLVVAGDLSQDIGASVSRGEALLTIAPAEDFRVTLRVDERRIADIVPGQTGQLLATALPETPFAIEIRRITPVAEYGEGATTFRVEAALTDAAPGLQPGMEGVAKVDIGTARRIAIWSRPMVDWMRISAWKWLGIE